MRRGSDFSDAVRRGARGASRRLVVNVDAPRAEDHPSPEDTLVGFVVGRAVGNAVTRNTVKRRLRHLVAERLGHLPVGSRVVVRALPASAGASSADLAADLDAALSRALHKVSAAGRPR